MNHSLNSADRMTHLRIIVAALVAATAVVGVGISVRLRSDNADARTTRVIKAGGIVRITSSTVGATIGTSDVVSISDESRSV